MPNALLGTALLMAGSLRVALAVCISGCDNGEYPKWWSWRCECDEGWKGRCCDKPICKDIRVSTEVDLDEWTRATWYIQQQQVTGYQPAGSLHCVTATYSRGTGAWVPFFRGEVVSVYNYANEGAVNGPPQNANNQTLCARLADPSQPGKLSVAPCFLPNWLSGPYWIIGVGVQDGRYTWAVVIGGEPTEKYSDGCATATEGINGAGLWLFSREPEASEETIQAMKDVLDDQGISKSQLLKVEQAGCSYAGAFIKP